MKNQIIKSNCIRNLIFGITTLSTVISFNNLVSAQITPDNTLPNNSEVGIEGNITKIEGGTTAGSNLFHSFEKFGISTGTEAHFNNAADIQNIFTRVTGKSFSDIDGLIKANGAANLFLINPNGILFGENARLDIGGSFVGSSADSLIFPNNSEFSAVNPDSKPLLSVNVPLGLQYGTNPGNISVKGDGKGIRKSSEIVDTQNALRVKADETLGLIGGDINLEGATLKTAGGRIELGSVKEDLVNIITTEKGFSFDYNAVNNGGDINLSQQAAVDASGEGAGDIQVWGKNIKLVGDSQIETSTLGSENGGDLVVNAQDSVEVIGASGSILRSALGASVFPEATGNGGNLIINTQNLLLRDSGEIITATFGNGNGANLTVNAQDVQLIGITKDGLLTFITALGTSAEKNSIGNAGNLNIKTNTLLVKDGALVGTSTFGAGKGGDLSIDARNVQLIGESKDGQIPSRLITETNSTGDAGDLSIQTNNLLVTDGAAVDTNTFNEGKGGNLNVEAQNVQLIGTNENGNSSSGLFAIAKEKSTGNAGDLTIKTNNLLVEDGSQVATSTFSEGKAGNLLLEAQNVQLIGTTKNGQVSSGLFSSNETDTTGDAGNLTIITNSLQVKNGAQVNASTFGKGKGGNLNIDAQQVQLIGASKNDIFSFLLASAQLDATGTPGNLKISTNSLLVKNGAAISVQNLGTGIAGNVNIIADSIQLDEGFIVASTLSTNGGNINLDIADLLLMRNGSEISSTAGFASATGDGGNININSPNGFIVATPNQNNDITANAFQGKGGRVKIDAAGIFGMNSLSRNELERLRPDDLNPFQLPTNDITAISQQNSDLTGFVEIITPETNPENALTQLPTEPIETKITNTCSTPGYAQSSFTITGKGSLPPSPSEPLTGRVNQTKLATLDEVEETKVEPRKINKKPKRKQIVEARGWVKNKNGEIFLVANPPQNSNIQAMKNPNYCS